MNEQIEKLEAEVEALREQLARIGRQARSIVTEARQTTPDAVIEAKFAPVLQAMRRYGRCTLTIYRNGHVQVNVSDGREFWHMIGEHRSIQELLDGGWERWDSLEHVNGLWGIHKPTARSGDYRRPETWEFGRLDDKRSHGLLAEVEFPD